VERRRGMPSQHPQSFLLTFARVCFVVLCSLSSLP
jgi:hypothetical protein